MRRKRFEILMAAALLICSPFAFATDLIESPDFDISDDQNNPTAFDLTLGTNLLIASTGGGTGGATNGSDAEFIGVTVPAGMTLESITLNAYDHIFPTNRAFVAYESGSTTLQAPIADYLDGTAPEPNNVLFGTSDLGGDIFTGLGAGPFAFWIQETNPNPASYEMSFHVVPEPAGWLMVLSLVFGWALSQRGR